MKSLIMADVFDETVATGTGAGTGTGEGTGTGTAESGAVSIRGEGVRGIEEEEEGLKVSNGA